MKLRVVRGGLLDLISCEGMKPPSGPDNPAPHPQCVGQASSEATEGSMRPELLTTSSTPAQVVPLEWLAGACECVICQDDGLCL